MRTVTYRLADLSRAVIPLGFVGENQHTRVIFDAAKVFAEYPAAVPALTVQPPQGTSYPAVVVRDGDYVYFDVSDSDLIHAGTGELQLAFVQDAVHVRTFIARTRIDRSIVPTGEIPEPLEDFLEAASAAVAAIPQEVADGVAEGFGAVTAGAETLAAGSDATAEFNTETKVLTIGVPVGADGHDGAPGADGFSPVASVSKLGDTATISITDKTGTTTATVKDGTDGQDGAPGADGYSPSASVSKSGATATITITDKSGTTTATVSDGTPVIDDTAGSGDTDKVWSANKSAGEISNLNTALNGKVDEPSSEGTSGQVLTTDGNGGRSWSSKPSVPVTDVQVNGTSVLSQGVANVPIATQAYGETQSSTGLMYARNGYDGVRVMPGYPGRITLNPTTSAQIKAGNDAYLAVTTSRQHESLYYALAKLAGADMASLSGETVGVYPSAQLVAIQKMLGIYEAPWELIREDTVTNATEADIEITVDGDGNAFELTDVRIVFWLDSTDAAASKGEYGAISVGNTQILKTVYIGAWTQNIGATRKVAYASFEQKDGMLVRNSTANQTNTGNAQLQTPAYTQNDYGMYTFTEQLIFTRVKIPKVTGKACFRIYGKRKWTV